MFALAFTGCGPRSDTAVAGPDLPVAHADTKAVDEPLPSEASPASRQIAVTIDDLPVAMYDLYESDDRQLDIVRKLCALVGNENVPTVGFANMKWHDSNPRLMETWKNCPISLGNHTWSHPHLDRVGIDAYIEDLVKGHEALVAFTRAEQPIFFRYPFLFQGFRPTDRERIAQQLATLGSRHAPVTIDTWDWLYSRGYTEARQAGDTEAMQRYHTSWSWNLQEATQEAEVLSRQLFDREPPQVLLIHANELNAEFLAEYFEWLRARGYQFVSLDTALADPAYHEIDRSWSPTGESLWLRLARSRSLMPAEQAGAWRSLPVPR